MKGLSRVDAETDAMSERQRENWRLLGITLLGVVMALLFLGGSWGRMAGMGPMGGHRMGMMGGVPSDYAGRRNPVPSTAENLRAGAELYRGHCAVCHGQQGRGDGPAAAGMNPKPADLRRILSMPMVRDDYLFWVISEGRVRNGGGMPSFGSVLDETARWQLVGYLQQL